MNNADIRRLARARQARAQHEELGEARAEARAEARYASRSQQRRVSLVNCPYDECTFQGTQAEVDEHVTYLIGIGDPEHAADKLRERH